MAREARFAHPDSGTQGEVCCSTHLTNLKSVASSIPEILKEFKICGQTDVQKPCVQKPDRQTDRQTPLPTVKTLPATPHFVARGNPINPINLVQC